MIISDQVAAALAALSPDVKKRIRRAMRDLENGVARDVHPLRSPLERFSTLRIGNWRLIHRWQKNEVIAEYLGNRDDVYEKAEKELT